MSVPEGVRVKTALILMSSITKRGGWGVFNGLTKEVYMENKKSKSLRGATFDVIVKTLHCIYLGIGATGGGSYLLFKLRSQRVLCKYVKRDPLEAEQEG